MYFRWSLVLLLAVLPATPMAQASQAHADDTAPASQVSSQPPATVTCVSKAPTDIPNAGRQEINF
jgi:hypothetical protein